MKIFLSITLLTILSSCTSSNINNERDIMIDDTVIDFLTTPVYLDNRAVVNGSNIAVVNPNYDAQKIRPLKTFLGLYKKEKKSHGWVIIYESGHNTTKMEKMIENNITVYARSNAHPKTYEKQKMKLNLYGAEIRVVTETINNVCDSSFILEKNKQKIILFTRKNITLQDLCDSYPVILGINGFQILEKDNMLHITKYD